jgi:hypothetical protein
MVARTLLGMTPPPPERVIPVRTYSPPAAEREPADGESGGAPPSGASP